MILKIKMTLKTSVTSVSHIFPKKYNNDDSKILLIKKEETTLKKKKNHLIYWCWNVVELQFPRSSGQFARNSSETVRYHKLPHQEIRWNFRIFRSAIDEEAEVSKWA